MAKQPIDLNYNFKRQKDPQKPMGFGDFANLPKDAKFMNFSNVPQYRQGVVNSFTANLEEVSEIYENQRQD